MNALVLGSGMMGYAATYDLVKSGMFAKVYVGDIDAEKLDRVSKHTGAETIKVNVNKTESIKQAFKMADVVLSAVPYFYNLKLTRIAISMKKHMCDLGGNIDIVHEQLALNEKAQRMGVTIIPDCGLAPGTVNILAAKLISMLEQADDVKLRVGGLPQTPKPPLEYSLVFSAHGLINEYMEKCIALRNGELAYLDPLEDLEQIHFEGLPELEAFNTSGGSSTLPFTFRGRVKNLDYKTIRYAGHCEKIKLLFSLGLGTKDPIVVDNKKVVPRNVLAKLLEMHLARSEDMVLLRVTASGITGGVKKTLAYEMIDKQDKNTGHTAMMRTTAYPASVIAIMLGQGMPLKGVLPGELAINADTFITELQKRGLKIQYSEQKHN